MRKKIAKAIVDWYRRWLRRSEAEKLALVIQYLVVLKLALAIWLLL
jgi:hypothetical protein